jgi:hypothetical protein
MITLHRRIILVFAAVLATSATLAQTNPSAVIADSAEGGGPGGGTFFMVTAVDGNPVPETALTVSGRASAGRGAYMLVRGAERSVPSGKVSLTLRGIQTHVAPIDTIFRAIFRGGNPEVTGSVTVELAPGQRYLAKGLLDGFRREIWLEDEKGAVVAGSRVAIPPDPELVKQMEGATFTATNLRYEGDWISEVSWLNQSFIPAGSRLKVVDYGSNRASVLVDGKKMRMGIDWSRGKETIQQFVARATTGEDPRKKIAEYPEKVRDAIRAGRVFAGMTKDQVLLSLGRPRVDFVPSLSANEWKYEIPEQEEMYFVFDESGALREIDGSRKARKLVVYEGSQ